MNPSLMRYQVEYVSQTCQFVHADWNVPCRLRVSRSHATAKEGWTRQFITWELQTNLQLVNCLQSIGTSRIDSPASSTAWISHFQQLPVADKIKAFGVVLDRRLAFGKHWRCHDLVITMHRLFTTSSTDDGSGTDTDLILTRLNYCNSVMYGALVSSIERQNNAASIILQASRQSHALPLLHKLHWLPVQHRIDYKLSVLT